MPRLHRTYRRKPADTLVGLDDIAHIAGVQRDTARKWASLDTFPPTRARPADCPVQRVWHLGDVLAWLCDTGRRDCGGTMLTKADVARRLELTESTISVYIWRGKFPPPDKRVRGKAPLWHPSTIDRWIAEGGRVDLRTTPGAQAKGGTR